MGEENTHASTAAPARGEFFLQPTQNEAETNSWVVMLEVGAGMVREEVLS